MQKLTISLLVTLIGIFTVHAQYTETINSNRPGESQGAYAVGKNVLQLEAGPYFGNDNHDLYQQDTDIFGAFYGLRYGFFSERLEVSLMGAFQWQTTTINVANREQEFKTSNFKSNTLGAKFLIFDPNRSLEPNKPNLYSWKANQGIQWQSLVPAVSVYAGANFSFGDNPYLYEGEDDFSPKAAIITQNNWGRWVLVLNFIADKFTEDNPTYAGIATLTHAITPKFAIFGEYQGYISDIYADDIARAGAAYLFTKDFQLDLSGLINFKDTPSRWQVAAGISYRLDMHNNDEFLDDSNAGNKRRARSEKKFGKENTNQRDSKDGN